MQTIGDRIWYRISAFVKEEIAARLNQIGFTGSALDASHISGIPSTTLVIQPSNLPASVTSIPFLVTTAAADLSAEVVVGTTPGGELGGSWASPTVDATHSGSSHAGVVTTHEAAADPHTGYLKENDANWIDLTDAGETTLHSHAGGSHPDLATHDALGLATDTELTTHAGAADPHTGYRLESADHTHATTGLQAGTVSHGALTDRDQEDHSEYIPRSLIASDGDMITYFDGQIQTLSVIGTEGDVLTTNGDGIPEWRGAPVLGAYKDTDQEVTSTTLASDSELTVTLATNGKYQLRLVLFFLNDGATEGIKVSLAGTATVTDVKAQVYANGVSLGRITALGGAGLGVAATGSSHVAIEGAIEITTAGTLLLQFAQNATGASAGVHCEFGSSMMVSKLG